MALAWRWMIVGMMALFPITSHALALGKLTVLSALNEPLNAEIEFTSANEKN
jgi:Tfp pilus assembly protein FimV